jgi:hypothetical protein
MSSPDSNCPFIKRFRCAAGMALANPPQSIREFHSSFAALHVILVQFPLAPCRPTQPKRFERRHRRAQSSPLTPTPLELDRYKETGPRSLNDTGRRSRDSPSPMRKAGSLLRKKAHISAGSQGLCGGPIQCALTHSISHRRSKSMAYLCECGQSNRIRDRRPR